MLRRLEMTGGLLTGIAGLVGLAYALYGPTSTMVESQTTAGSAAVTTTARSATLAEQGVQPAGLLFMTVALVCTVAVMAGAYLHVRHDDSVGLAVVCVAAALLLGETILGAASIGVFLAPAALLALSTASVAVVAGSRRRAAGG